MPARPVSAPWLALWALACITGAALQLQQPALWSTGAYAVMSLVGGIVLALTLWFMRSVGGQARLWAQALTALVLLTLLLGLTGLRAHHRLAEALPAALEGRDLWLTGTVSSLPQAGANGWRFRLQVETALQGDVSVSVPRHVMLNWPRGFDGDTLLAGPLADLRAGDRWLLPVRLRAPYGLMNPHGFDTELWLFEQGVRAVGTVRSRADAQALRQVEAVAHPVERLRQKLRDAVLLNVADPTAAGVLAALAVGDQAAIDTAQWDLFRATGIAHLMSISGLHVTMFAWAAAAAVGTLWRRFPRAMRLCPTPVAALWGGLALAALYALLAGWGVPAQRTVWMLATVALLRHIGRRWPPGLVLLAAAVVVTLLDPWALLQPGFWLSFCAVGLLMHSGGHEVREPFEPAQPAASWPARALQALRQAVRTQAVATVGLAPLGLVFFQQLSVPGFFANLLAIPWVTLVVTPLALGGLLWPALWLPGAWAVQGLQAVLQPAAAWPWAVWHVAAAPPWAVAGGLLGAVCLMLRWPLPLRLAGLGLMLPLLWPAVPRPPPGQAELVVVDIGQGTAVLVRTAGHLLVYDTGPRWSDQADAGQRVLLPLLRARGEARVDALVISHRDSDHVGGAASLLAAVPVEVLRSSLEPGHPLLTAPVNASAKLPAKPLALHTRCEAGQRWQWDGVQFEFLHPLPADYDRGLPSNGLSCVLRVQPAQGPALLLSGDIEAAQELELVARAGDALRTPLLLLPHHGSATSTTPELLRAVQPQTALIQAGYRSRYGHPAPGVLARLQAHGVAVVRTDTCGAWTLAPDAPPRCERDAARRYWHHRVH